MNLNCTDINGTLVRVVYITKKIPQTTSADDSADDEYDQTGAMHFIVATVLVYSILGVFCVLINRIKTLGGKSYYNYIHDESIHMYLKNEKSLKVDGKRLKLQYECELVSEKLKQYEERSKVQDPDIEATSDTLKQNSSNSRRTRRARKKNRGVGSTLENTGTSLFYIGPDPSQVINKNTSPGDSDVVNFNKSESNNVSENMKTLTDPKCSYPKSDSECDDHIIEVCDTQMTLLKCSDHTTV